MAEFVRVDVDEASRVATIRLDRPPVNALNAQVQDELRQAAGQVSGDERVGAVVLYGGEKVFAAGADIKEMAGQSFAAASARAGDLQATFTALARIPKVVIAAVTGYALGGGCELALTADFRFAASDARFGQPEILLGIIPGAGGTQRLTRAVGKARAMEMVLTGSPITAREAYACGLVNRVVPVEVYLEEAKALATQIASRPPLAVQLGKDAVLKAFDTTIEQGLDYERKNFYLLFATEDMREGMAAFVEKREAEFKGR